MERLPVTRVTVPVESGSRIFRVDVEILTDFLEDGLVGGAVFGVLADEVAPFVPWDPLTSFLAVFLEITHLFD